MIFLLSIFSLFFFVLFFNSKILNQLSEKASKYESEIAIKDAELINLKVLSSDFNKIYSIFNKSFLLLKPNHQMYCLSSL